MANRNSRKNRNSIRLREYDYSKSGWYYVTICTKDHKEYFGKVKNEDMILNDIGKIADEYWRKIPLHFPYSSLDKHIIMPNHIHGIIIIDCKKDAKFASSTNNTSMNVGDANLASQDRTKMELSKIIQQFKRAVTIKIKYNKPISNFKWQRSFYDRIIRNENELYNIRKYIQQNPLKWDLERNIINWDI